MSAERVLIVEDHQLLAQSLCIALAAEGLNVAVAPLTTPVDVLAVVRAGPPPLILLDLDLGAGIGDGTALVHDLVSAAASVLVVTGVVEEVRIAAAVEAGAIGYVPKSRPLGELVAVVSTAASGGQVLSQAERFRLLASLRAHREEDRRRHEPFEQLTHREQQVLEALADGFAVGAIARSWVVSEATVRTQVRGVLTKLGVCSQLAAVAMARQRDWTVGAWRDTKTTNSSH